MNFMAQTANMQLLEYFLKSRQKLSQHIEQVRLNEAVETRSSSISYLLYTRHFRYAKTLSGQSGFLYVSQMISSFQIFFD
jgi:hypothetical protein